MNIHCFTASVHVARHRALMVLLAVMLAFTAVTPTRAQSDAIDTGKTTPNSRALANYYVGVFYQSRGNHERAIAEFSITLESLPGLAYAFAARGDSYAAIGSYDEAIVDYSTAIDIYPDFVSVLYMRGRAYVALGNLDLAFADYANAIGQMPEYAKPYWGLGDLYYETGNYVDALKNYQRYLLLDSEPDMLVTTRVEELTAVITSETL